MKKLFFYVLLLATFFTVSTYAQQTTIDVRTGYGYSLDSNYQPYSLVSGKDKNKFFVNDVYVTYVSDTWNSVSGSASVNYNPIVGLNLYTAFVNYNFGVSESLNLSGTVSAGRVENNYYSYAEKQWSNPEISYTISRRFGLLPVTSDGASLTFKNTLGFASVMVANNGTDSSKSISAVIGVSPIKQLKIAGVFFKSENTQVYGGNLQFGGKSKLFGLKGSIGGEVLATDNSVTKSLAFSVFGEVGFKALKGISFLGRYDNLQPDTNISSTYTSVAGGISWMPVSFMKAGLNFRSSITTNTSRHNELGATVRVIF